MTKPDEIEVDGDLYRKVLGRYPTGVTIVTGLDGENHVGMVIGSFVSVSMDPPLVGFLPDKSSSTWGRIADCGFFGVNILRDSQLDTSNAFFKGPGDPFESLDYTVGASGAARIAGCAGWLDCRVHEMIDAGDHWMVLGRVIDLDCEEVNEPLLFLGGGYGSFTELG